MDKIPRFYLRPNEFIKRFDNIGEDYRWFYISKKKKKARDISQYLSVLLDFSWQVDGQQSQMRVWKNYTPEIMKDVKRFY